jgi:hypothetical protein
VSRRPPHDVSHVYPVLKDFQRRSVDAAARELFEPGGTRRFLVADEVGLGKTVVARGLIARAIELHDRERRKRTDIVYVCSNGDIARQNVRRLNVLPEQDFAHATRLTMLPQQMQHFQSQPLNFVSFTPGTSFDLRSSEGIAPERAILLRMLQGAWRTDVQFGELAARIFAGSAHVENFLRRASSLEATDLDPTLMRAFADALTDSTFEAELKAQFVHLRREFGYLRHEHASEVPNELRQERAAFVGQLRTLLARACIGALEPRLVILDEFQRFKHLLDPDSEQGALAQALFQQKDVAVLLLSATPYKMYTRGDEDEDHYRDFIETIGFLRQDIGAVDGLRNDIERFRRGILRGDANGHAEAYDAKGRIEQELRRVMSRNERVSVSPDASAMIETRVDEPSRLTADDVRRFRTLRLLGHRVGASGAMHYWEALPYPLSNLDGYHFWNRLIQRMAERPQPLKDLDLQSLSIDAERVHDYSEIEPGNARMRALEKDTVESGMWSLLWLPPSLPYYALSGPHAAPGLTATKRLIFSNWRAVPRAIATHLSFAAERRMVRGEDVVNTPEDRKGHRPLVFGAGEQIRGMRTLALLLPSVSLAKLGDPLAIVRGHAGSQAQTGAPLSLDEVREIVASRVAEKLERIAKRADNALGVDDRWYAAAPLLLDVAGDKGRLRRWLESDDVEQAVSGMTESDEDDGQVARSEGLRADLDLLLRYLDGEEPLGAMPDDLVQALTDLAIAGPGISALRALRRVIPGVRMRDPEMRTAALRISDSLRTIFNSREVGVLLRGLHGGSEAELWRAVLTYCAEGNLQSVLDEWLHVLHDGLATQVTDTAALIDELSETARDAIRIKTVNLTAQAVHKPPRAHHYRMKSVRMRANFALRFGDDQTETDKTLRRGAAIRTAFNSPFRPFVLATTSVGQEGLDFHVYCHAVVHWNLPRNPVDLEQREGRVHRYKNHAVRRNLAAAHRGTALGADGDPWQAMFQAAAEARDGDELVPYWIFRDGPARIERHVPALPLSREDGLHTALKRSTAAYRLVFGQPRQDDLLSYLEGQSEADLKGLTIDLRPR